MQSLAQVNFLTNQQAQVGLDIQLIPEVDAPLTNRALQEFIKTAQIQRAEFEKEHGMLFAEERKKA